MKKELSRTDKLGLKAMLESVKYLGLNKNSIPRKDVDLHLHKVLSLDEWEKPRLYRTLGWFVAYKPRLIDTRNGWTLTDYGKKLYGIGDDAIQDAILANRKKAQEEANAKSKTKISDILKDRPFIVIDLYSGSYARDFSGHEKYNLELNPVDGKYYGYCPPFDDIDIKRLGAKKGETSVDGITVIYVQKTANSNNREIIAFCDGATVYSPKIVNHSLRRLGTDKDANTIDISYSIESDNMINLTAAKNKFIIDIAQYNVWMFRYQRYFKGGYPTLDDEILRYLESCRRQKEFVEDEIYQDDIQESFGDSGADRDINIGNGSASEMVKKNPVLAKNAISKANFKCEFNGNHSTFMNAKGVQYMEGHHLIPCTPFNARLFSEMYGVNIDCIENIVSLCPVCHRRIHFGSKEEKRAVIKKLYELRKADLEKIGITITLQELYNLYE